MAFAGRRGFFAAVGIAIIAAGAASAGGRAASGAPKGNRQVSTTQITFGNGPSTAAVLSGDRRWARVIAFHSEASNLVRGDTNQASDVFVIRRKGKFANVGRYGGAPWQPGATRLASRTKSGAPAIGASYAPAIGGGFDVKPRCVAFLSRASNIVTGDRNRVVDAFVAGLSGRGLPRRVSLPGGQESREPTTRVAVSGDCSKVAFVTGGRLYVANRHGGAPPHGVPAVGAADDPSFAVGRRNDLVFGDSRGVVLALDGTGATQVVAPGGRNPAYNVLQHRVVAYEKDSGGHQQIAFRRVGGQERIATRLGGELGNGDSRDPYIADSGAKITFETDATNLGVAASGRAGDDNGKPDAYLYTDNRKLTLLESVKDSGVPLLGGGRHPSMNFYANYVVFDSPAPLNAVEGPHQIFLRYLGGI
jgi:hypothetical protein